MLDDRACCRLSFCDPDTASNKMSSAAGFSLQMAQWGGGSAHTVSYLYVSGARALRDVTPHTPNIILGLAVMQPSIHRVYFMSKCKIPDLEGVYTGFYINPSHHIYLFIYYTICEQIGKVICYSRTSGCDRDKIAEC